MTVNRILLRDWVEPAHPSVIKLHEDLITIYQLIRKEHQVAIDGAFDRVSRKIGFIVTTTLPVVLEMNDKNVVQSFRMRGEHLKGTLFEDELSPVLESFSRTKLPATAGTYRLYLLWFQALELRLRRDWVEPAHFAVGPGRIAGLQQGGMFEIGKEKGMIVDPFVQEPAHWFDPGIAIAAEELVLISAIDQVFSELRLADRINFSRHGSNPGAFSTQTQMPG